MGQATPRRVVMQTYCKTTEIAGKPSVQRIYSCPADKRRGCSDVKRSFKLERSLHDQFYEWRKVVLKGFARLTSSFDPTQSSDATACVVEADAVFGLSGAASISFLDLKKNLEAWERILKSRKNLKVFLAFESPTPNMAVDRDQASLSAAAKK